MEPTETTVCRGSAKELVASLEGPRESFLVVDENVLVHHPFVGEASTKRFVVPSGEEHKSWETLGRLLEAMDEARVDRGDQLIAFGGGVTTDLAGLGASLYRRGLPWIAVPTTLIGQVDAACGGKTAVNLAGGKNAVGTFHLPSQLVVDPDFLTTLPLRQVQSGMVELLKTAILEGEDLLTLVEALEPASFIQTDSADQADRVIACALTVKESFVKDDVKDEGPRWMLNLGHSFGHAFEALALPDLLHGEAIGLGLLCAARLGAHQGGEAGLEERLRKTLDSWGLPLTPPEGRASDPEALLDTMRRDKKVRKGQSTVILPLSPGRVEVLEGPSQEALRMCLEAVLEPIST